MRRFAHFGANSSYVKYAPASAHKNSNSATLRVWIEGVLFILLLSANATLISHTPFFRITDIKITGSDSFVTSKAHETVRGALTMSGFKQMPYNYFAARQTQIARQLENEIVATNISVKKIFPHTIIAVVEEERPSAVVNEMGVWFYVNEEGKIIRLLGNFTSGTNSIPSIILKNDATDVTNEQSRGLREQIVSPDVIKAVKIALHTNANERTRPKEFIIQNERIDAAVMIYEEGSDVIIDLTADVRVQCEKAKLARKKYLRAKQLDVRFGDKIYTSF